jgi:hypothetical protein
MFCAQQQADSRLATRLARQTRPSRRSKSAATIQMTQQQQDDDDSSLDGARNKRRRRSPAGARASPTSSRKTREPRRRIELAAADVVSDAIVAEGYHGNLSRFVCVLALIVSCVLCGRRLLFVAASLRFF